MIDYLNKQREGAAVGVTVVAAVAAVDSGGVTLTMDGQTGTKKYKRLHAAQNLSAGDLVLCLKTSGTWVVLDKIV